MSLTFEEYVRHDATGLAALVRAGAVTAAELVEVAIARAQQVNPPINAIAHPLFDEARAASALPITGPFAGVPFSIKDLNHPVAGAPLTHGSRAFAGNIAAEDGEATTRFRAAGLVPICISTSPEFGLSVTTESTLFGATRNPWDLSRSSGGSSGGASALVAAGVMPMAHATDGGGSIRVPAACCGLFGLKPSRGRTPIGYGRTEGWGGLTASFAITRSVRDAARLLDAVAGAPAGARSVAPSLAGSASEAIERAPARLRIGIPRQLLAAANLHPDCAAALDDVARLLSDLGHGVEECQLDLSGLAEAMTVTVAAHTAALLDSHGAARGKPVEMDEIEQVTAALVALGRAAAATQLIAADGAFQQAAIRMAELHQRFDLILTPTLAQPPAPIGEVALMRDPLSYASAFAAYCPFTAIANQTGQPAMSVPLHWNAEGLPIGIQFIGRLGEEAVLLSLAAELEQARPWFHRRPVL
ncbi:amidase [Erythrobacter sp. NE805]|uniref:amidase n=1 Tax=Erythrobacter sp. NE805 TaxID=3389875 RepID=UPI00396AF3D9